MDKASSVIHDKSLGEVYIKTFQPMVQILKYKVKFKDEWIRQIASCMCPMVNGVATVVVAAAVVVVVVVVLVTASLSIPASVY